jgi:hypothetical protein
MGFAGTTPRERASAPPAREAMAAAARGAD